MTPEYIEEQFEKRGRTDKVALELSIEKWNGQREAKDGEIVTLDAEACALCRLHARSYRQYDPSPNSCALCPLAVVDDCLSSEGSYQDAEAQTYDDDGKHFVATGCEEGWTEACDRLVESMEGILNEK